MLGDTAVKFYKNGEGCYTCILKACEEFYNYRLPQDICDMTAGFGNGFGVSGMCSAVVTSIMFLSYYFKNDEAKMKCARIFFLDTIHEKFGTTCCGRLQKCCKKAIYECGETLEKTINKYG